MQLAARLSSWDKLPAEMKYAVADHLNTHEIHKFSRLSRETYALSIPSLYKDVHLRGSKALRSFLDSVPDEHCAHVRTLNVDFSMGSLASPLRATTFVSDLFGDLLSRCLRLEELVLSIPGSLKPTVIPVFGRLYRLRKLCISNCERDENTPLSERLVVSIAATIPHLSHLELDRVCRSTLHAPELVGAYPFVPVLAGDDNIPAHPLLGNSLCLPSLLCIPTLRVLRIRDTHLGDERWATTAMQCKLDVLEIGSCCYESPDFNRICADRIVDAVAQSVTEMYLGSPLSSDPTCMRHLRLLKSLHISPLLPVENLVETLAALSRSPVASLSLHCHEDDLVEEYVALEELVSLCREHQGKKFFSGLRSVSLHTIADLYEPIPPPSPKFGFKVRQPSSDGASVLQRLQRCLEQAPNTGIEQELCSSRSCGFALPTPGGLTMTDEKPQWMDCGCQ